MWLFYLTIINKPNYLHSQTKNHLFALLSVIFSLFNVHNQLFWIHVHGICTSDKYFFFQICSYRLQSICKWYHGMRAGRVDSFSLIFHTPWIPHPLFTKNLTTPTTHLQFWIRGCKTYRSINRINRILELENINGSHPQKPVIIPPPSLVPITCGIYLTLWGGADCMTLPSPKLASRS